MISPLSELYDELESQIGSTQMLSLLRAELEDRSPSSDIIDLLRYTWYGVHVEH